VNHVARLLAAAPLFVSGLGIAAPPALELADCPSLSQAILNEHLALELSTLGLADAESRVLLRCTGSVVVVELETAPGARYPIEVRVQLRDTVPAERERLVALAASELVARAERPASEPERLEPVSTAANVAPALRLPPRARPAHELFVAGSVGFAGYPKTALWGAGLGARLGLRAPWALLLDSRFERGHADVPWAEVRWSSLSGLVGAGASYSVGPWQLSLGLGARGGWLSFDTVADSPHRAYDLTAPWLGVALPLRAALETGAGVVPFVGVEGGYVLLPVRGVLDDGSVLSAQRGAWLSLSLGLGVSL
jgi:hypothetical protein